MPSAELNDERIRELAAWAERYGRILADEAYGPEGPGLDVDLTTMESLAVTMQQSLLKGMCEQLTERQAERLPDVQPCPDCGAECRLEPAEPDPEAPPDKKPSSRPLQTRGGAFELVEPRYYCRSCRTGTRAARSRTEGDNVRTPQKTRAILIHIQMFSIA